MISTRNLSELPAVDQLRSLTQSLAMLDAIIERNWEGRNYSFNQHWNAGEQLASMRNGEGDEWLCVFSKHGAFLKGLYQESEMARGLPGVLDSVSDVFRSALTEPAFSMEYTSFCIWRTYADDRWHTGHISFPPGDDPDGSAWMLAILDGNPISYQRWAEDYYKRPVRLPAVEHVYAYKKLTDEVVRALNPETNLSELAADISKIGYLTHESQNLATCPRLVLARLPFIQALLRLATACDPGLGNVAVSDARGDFSRVPGAAYRDETASGVDNSYR